MKISFGQNLVESLTFALSCAPNPHCLVFASRGKVATLLPFCNRSISSFSVTKRPHQRNKQTFVYLGCLLKTNTKLLMHNWCFYKVTAPCYLHCPQVCCWGRPPCPRGTKLASGSHHHVRGAGAPPHLSYSHQSVRSSHLCTFDRFTAVLRQRVWIGHRRSGESNRSLFMLFTTVLRVYTEPCSSYPTATEFQLWGEQVRQKMVLGSGKKLAVSPVWYQWHTTMPFSSPDTTRFLSTGDQCTAETGFCVWGRHNFTDIMFIPCATIISQN